MISSKNLKEIIMDDSEFYSSQRYIEGMSNLENDRDTFIFHCCSKTLERVSIRNAKYSTFNYNYGLCVPQSALTKFIRDGPPTYVGFEVIYQKKI